MRRGFSLVELIFALLVLQFGILAAAGLVLLAQKNLNHAELVTRGVLEVGRVADSLARGGEEGSGSLDYSWGRILWGVPENGLGTLEVVAVPLSGEDTLARAISWGPLATLALPTRDSSGSEEERR